MENRERDDSGQFKEKVSLDDVLSTFEPREPLTASEIANKFDISNRAALNKLEDLYAMGKLHRKDVGSRAVVWWLTENQDG